MGMKSWCFAAFAERLAEPGLIEGAARERAAGMTGQAQRGLGETARISAVFASRGLKALCAGRGCGLAWAVVCFSLVAWRAFDFARCRVDLAGFNPGAAFG